jgi:hypothetical protein
MWKVFGPLKSSCLSVHRSNLCKCSMDLADIYLLLVLRTKICFKKFILARSVSRKIYACQRGRAIEMWLYALYEAKSKSESESESYRTTTDGQSASLSWNKAPVWCLRPDCCYYQTVVGLLMWGALSDDRTGLSFTIASGPRQHSDFRIRVPWDTWLYFTVSDSRLPFSSPPTTRRATVEVF